MKITLLGAHNLESATTGCVSLLIDGVMALDAGHLTSSLSFEDQLEVKYAVLTHPHYDHVRDIPGLAMNLALQEKSLDVFAIQPIFKMLEKHFTNDTVYPDYFTRPAEKPALRKHVLKYGEETAAGPYRVLALPMVHSVPASGVQVTGPDGHKLFFTGDTGPGIKWDQASPDVLVIEATALNKWDQFARNSGHLTPALLEQELVALREHLGRLPRVVTVHMNPLDEAELRAELDLAGSNLGVHIESGYEGMCLEL
jgi:ribonuclease BN (tRNA processing enzyme)